MRMDEGPLQGRTHRLFRNKVDSLQEVHLQQEGRQGKVVQIHK